MEVCKATPRSKLADGYPTTKRKKEKKGNTNKQALRVLRGDPLWMSVTSVNEFGSCEVLFDPIKFKGVYLDPPGVLEGKKCNLEGYIKYI